MLARAKGLTLFLPAAAAFLGLSQSGERPHLPDLGETFREVHWIAYAPTNYDPQAQPPVLPTNDSIRMDLGVLRGAGCDGLVTYGASLSQVVAIAEEVKFKAVLLGVWDPADEEELRSAGRSAASPIVVGLIVGNEGLMFRRYSAKTLKQAMDGLRVAARKPVATTEVIDAYYTKPELVEWSDFLAVNAHPFFHGKRNPADAVDWTIAAWKRLREHVSLGKPILFKEVGLPTNGQAGLSEQAQNEYYSRLRGSGVQFVYFEAFDALFKQGPLEQSWGLFHADRSPKLAAALLRRAATRDGTRDTGLRSIVRMFVTPGGD